MLNDIIYPKSGEYRTGTQNEPLNFFADVLPESKQFDILLGYFSSSAIRVLAFGFAKFLHNDGRARFVINHILSEKDKAAILRGEQNPSSALNFAMTDYQGLKKSLDTEGIHFFNCLAWMIASKRVEIVAVRPKEGSGIAHQKTGIFSDGQNELLFDGSCNFTAMALLGNIEKLSTRFSWENSARDVAAIEDEKIYFNQIFDKKATFVEYLEISDLETAIKTDFGNKDLDELLIDEITLLAQWQKKLKTNPKFKKRLEELEKELQILRGTPRFPHAEPRDYQKQAYQKWLGNGYQGIFAMATGTGKTLTSLNCLLEEYRKTGSYRAVILVPTIALVGQWEKEAKGFNFQNLIRISSKEKWQSGLERILMSLRWGARDENFILVCTYATFTNEKFQKCFRQLPGDTILIADESHNIGAGNVSRLLPTIHLQKRIGLSATPERLYDTEGSLAMRDFFNNADDYTFRFSMAEAIRKKYLCRYDYFPHIVPLETTEMAAYLEISKRLLKFFDFSKGAYRDSAAVNILLQQRVRIIQQAQGKLPILRGVLQKEFERRKTLAYSFVFVPEGFEKVQGDVDLSDSDEDVRLIEQYSRAIASIHSSIRVHDLTSQTKDREKILKYFAEGEIHVMTSMKCLDEGVDIPRAELAVFCSSTGNPRQFIQRRGRVLRMHEDKTQGAVIHDLVVVPNWSASDRASDTFNAERNLMRRELIRVAHFVDLAENKYEAMEMLNDICEAYDLNINILREEIEKQQK